MQGGYRIIDEGAARSGKPPWNPVSLFFLAGLFWPIGALPLVFNWGRLAQAEKRWTTAGVLLLAWLGPMLLLRALNWTDLSLDDSLSKLVRQLAKWIALYYVFGQQQPVFRLHLLNRGRKANSLILWGLYAAIGIVLLGAAVWVAARRVPPAPPRRNVPLPPSQIAHLQTADVKQGGHPHG